MLERPCVRVRARVCARVLGAVLCSQPFQRRLEAASPRARRPDGQCRRPLAGRPRAHALTGSLSCSGGGVRERRGGQAEGPVGGGAALGGTGPAGGMGLQSVPSRLREAGARAGPLC